MKKSRHEELDKFSEDSLEKGSRDLNPGKPTTEGMLVVTTVKEFACSVVLTHDYNAYCPCTTKSLTYSFLKVSVRWLISNLSKAKIY